MNFAIFLAAFLLFQIQPMIAKAILPWFGGVPAVWTACLLTFQLLLLAGYAYAHATRRWVHVALLVVSLAALPIHPAPPSTGMPPWNLLLLLLGTIGLPYFVLSSTSPLLQRWSGEANPYRLYALSNAGSFVGLLSYPFLVEPNLTLQTQLRIWSFLYAATAILLAFLSRDLPSRDRKGVVPTPDLLMWAALSATGTGLLMATTNQLTQEVGSVPFLWVLPLAIYLFSFVLCFERPHWYDRRIFAMLTSLFIPIACALSVVGLRIPFWAQLLVFSGALFCCLMVLHGEIAASRPEPAALTRFYLAIAAGGAAGGLFVALLAPLLFSSFLELPITLASTAALLLLQRYRSGEIISFRRLPPVARSSISGLGFAVVVPFLLMNTGSNTTLKSARNFFGILRVSEQNGQRALTHGTITHGMQFQNEAQRRTPTTYYGWASGVGQAISDHPRRESGPLRIGVVGLGIGTLARYGRPGDTIRFYEINPEVTALANRYFTYLKDSFAKIEVVEGDARLSLDREPPQRYDILALDAFTSDAIPLHLLTAEAGAIYQRHLAADGFLVVHISNHILNLEPVVRALAAGMGLNAVRKDNQADGSQGINAANWMILGKTVPPTPGASLVWTDDHTSLWRVLK